MYIDLFLDALTTGSTKGTLSNNMAANWLRPCQPMYIPKCDSNIRGENQSIISVLLMGFGDQVVKK